MKQLTYRQLRALEKIDADKARDAKYLDLVKEGVVAAGQVGRGIMQGTITGPVALFLLFSSEPQLLALAYQNFAALAGILGEAIKTGLVPDITKILNNNQANPHVTPPPPATGGKFALHQTGATAFQLGAGDQYYPTASDRDAAVTSINGDLWNRFVGKHVTFTWEVDPTGARVDVVQVPLPPAWIFPVI